MAAGRPRLKAGSFGAISSKMLDSGLWRARVLYRDNSGKRREATVTGRTKGISTTLLKKKMLEEILPDIESGSISRSMTVSDLASAFIAQKQSSRSVAPQTIDNYRSYVQSAIKPKIGELALSDVTPIRVQDFLSAVATEIGPARAQGCRWVLSGMFKMAVINGAMRANPIPSMASIKSKEGHRGSTALSPDELKRMRDVIRFDAELSRLDLVDLWLFLSRVGCRLGEALALRDSFVADSKNSVITLGPTVVRVTGKGSYIQEAGKTADQRSAGWRTITIADEAMAIVRRRLGHPSGLIFRSRSGLLRDVGNTEADWRANRVRLGFPTFTSHGFRKTVATELDKAGLSAREIADYLGHRRPSMTQDVYMAKGTDSSRAAEALGSHSIPTK